MLTPILGGRSDDDEGPTKHQQKAAGAKVAGLKAQLKMMLAQPLIARGVSTRYITSGVRSIADDMIAGECALFLALFFSCSSIPFRETAEPSTARLLLLGDEQW